MQAAVKELDDELRREVDRGEEAADGRSPGQVEPEQIEVRPDGAPGPPSTRWLHTAATSAYLAQAGIGCGFVDGDDPGGQQAGLANSTARLG